MYLRDVFTCSTSKRENPSANATMNTEIIRQAFTIVMHISLNMMKNIPKEEVNLEQI